MYMTSFRLLPEQKPLLNQLVNVLPTVTVIELDIVIKEMRSVWIRLRAHWSWCWALF